MLLSNAILFFYSICMLVLVILWLQSGLDKITDRKGNLEWLKGHFSKSVFKNVMPLLLSILTTLELLSGLAALATIGEIWIFHTWNVALFACILSMFTFLCLFGAQRIAKDYAGAASIVGYMIFTILVLAFTLVLLVSHNAHNYINNINNMGIMKGY